MKGLIIRIIKQMLNDRRSIALLILAPILIMTLMYLLLGDSSYEPKIGIDEGFQPTFLSALEEEDVSIIVLPKGEDINAKLENKEIDAMITMDAQGLTIRMLEADGIKVTKVTDALKSAMTTINPGASMEITFIYGDAQTSIFDNLGYILLGVISFFYCQGLNLYVKEPQGTLERLMLTPIRRYEVVSGLYPWGSVSLPLFIRHCRCFLLPIRSSYAVHGFCSALYSYYDPAGIYRGFNRNPYIYHRIICD